MPRSTEWLSKSIYILASSLYMAAVALRTWLFFQDEPVLGKAMALLLLWVLLFASEPVVSRRWPRQLGAYFPLYLIFQTCLVFILMSLPGTPDFMGTLLAILSMQIMLRLPTWAGAVWIALCAVIMTVLLVEEYGGQAFALSLVYTAGNVFFGSYMRTIRRNQAARLQNQELAGELEQANQRLQEYSTQAEQLAAARERNRLARELQRFGHPDRLQHEPDHPVCRPAGETPLVSGRRAIGTPVRPVTQRPGRDAGADRYAQT